MKEEVLKRLDQLADKLGTTAQYLFGLYVHQATIAVYQVISYGVIAVILWFMAYRMAITALKWAASESYKDRDNQVPYWIGCVVFGAVAFIFTTVMTTSELLTPLMNPQYWAFREILQDIRGR